MDALVLYDFRIDALKPDTLPMARLAEYLRALAALFDHEQHVHFKKIRSGSAIPEIAVEAGFAPAIESRLKLASTGESPDVDKAFRDLNTLLRADKASAMLKRKGGAKILAFPGHKTPLSKEAIVQEHGDVTGVVIRIGGKRDDVGVSIQETDGTELRCTASRALARELAPHLFEGTIRARGFGRWRRTAQRRWELDEFKIESFDLLVQSDIEQAVAGLRAVQGSGWNGFADPQAELAKLRQA